MDPEDSEFVRGTLACPYSRLEVLVFRWLCRRLGPALQRVLDSTDRFLYDPDEFLLWLLIE